MYYELYSLLQQYIFGLDVALTSYQDMVLTVCATVGVLFLVALPFILVWRIIKMFG